MKPVPRLLHSSCVRRKRVTFTEAAKKMAVIPKGWKPLPPDNNYKVPGYCTFKYRGMALNNLHIEWKIMQQLEQFQGRHSDIVVASFPKSGTTWLQEIVWWVTHYGEMAGGRRSGTTLEWRFPSLEVKPPEDLKKMKPLHDMADPRFIKTHLHYHILPESMKTSGAKILYVYRDARDVCVSYYHFSRMLSLLKYRGTFSEFLDSFMRDVLVFCPYREHVKGYLEHSDTVLCLTYEQMHQDRASVVKKVADFLGFSLTEAAVDDIIRNTNFEVMKTNPDTNYQWWDESGMVSGNDEGTFMRKGVIGDWKNYFTKEENEAFLKWWNEDIESL